MPSWLPGVLVALVGVIPAFLVWVQTDAARKSADRQSQRTASREDLDSAREFWRESLEAANQRIAQLSTDLDVERGETRRLRVRVGRLEDTLRRAGLAVPNGNEPP